MDAIEMLASEPAGCVWTLAKLAEHDGKLNYKLFRFFMTSEPMNAEPSDGVLSVRRPVRARQAYK